MRLVEEDPAETEWVDRAMRLGIGSRESTEKDDNFCKLCSGYYIRLCSDTTWRIGGDVKSNVADIRREGETSTVPKSGCRAD